ncbi:Trp biosynthesis-associated membrane protein [Microbacterium aquimaris]|uniref:Trp biosynthesis-associated membrane protein n=1 Tax=Microbacterium aquimaris TaxID=459816 RepID=A0ABU5N8L5_9MICO|nr:Trp biosynthesis-associated membrane protein [Microbacterium aquimaris]MDZ8162407.1 Trp biosynthesis-associated membrane protein [Microbacterium aquimaris]
MTRRPRSLAVLMILVAGALGVISSTQTWLVVTLASVEGEQLPVAGADAVPVLAPLSLAALALGAALTIVGRVLVYAFGVLTGLLGAVVAVASARVAIDTPVETYASTVTEATGITGPQAVRDLVSSTALTPWPVLTAVVAVVIVLAGVLTLVTAHRWTGSGRRYRQGVADDATESAGPGADPSRPRDAIDSWDDLSRGEDPTS